MELEQRFRPQSTEGELRLQSTEDRLQKLLELIKSNPDRLNDLIEALTHILPEDELAQLLEYIEKQENRRQQIAKLPDVPTSMNSAHPSAYFYPAEDPTMPSQLLATAEADPPQPPKEPRRELTVEERRENIDYEWIKFLKEANLIDLETGEIADHPDIAMLSAENKAYLTEFYLQNCKPRMVRGTFGRKNRT